MAMRCRFHGLLVAATVAAVVRLASVITVPDPHPETVHNFALNVSVGVCVAPMVIMPEPSMK
jgi:hypothetical protein